MRFIKVVLFLFLVLVLAQTPKVEAMTYFSNTYNSPVFVDSFAIEEEPYYTGADYDENIISASFKITNQGYEPVDVETSVLNGLTSSDGLSYFTGVYNGYSGFIDHEQQVIPLVKELPEVISLYPYETKTISFEFHLPEDAKGEYVGALGFTTIGSAYDNLKNDLSLETHTDTKINFVLMKSSEEIEELKYKKATFINESTQPKVIVDILNNNPNIVSNERVDYKVTRLEDKKVIFSGTDTIPAIAPYNYISYPVFWKGEMRSGEYDIEINNKRFNFHIDNDVTLVSKASDSVIIEKPYVPLFVWVTFVIIVAYFGYQLYVQYKK